MSGPGLGAKLSGFGLLLAIALPGCAGGAPEASAPSAAGQAGPGGASRAPLVRNLAPTALGGAETCFNATDDNGNLLLDEGCDVRQGDVHFMIAWSEPSIDVDLLVVDPAGSLAGTSGPSTLGLVLSDDCPRAGGVCSGQPFESVHLDADEVPPGTYQVRVVVQTGARSRLSRPLVVRFGARLRQAVVGREVEFSEDARDVTMTFSVEPEAVVGSSGD